MLAQRRFFSSLGFKYLLAIAVIAVGDWLFYRNQWFGSGFGMFAAAIALAALAGRPAIMRDRIALIAWLASLAFAGALILDPSMLSWLLFGASLGIAILKPRTGPFDDAWRWFQRLVWQTATSSILPMLDLVRLSRLKAKMRARGRPVRALPLRTLASTVALPLIGTAIFLMLFADANPVIRDWLGDQSIGDFAVLRPFLWGLLLLFAWNALRPRLARTLIPSFDGTGDVRILGVTVASVTLSLLMFNALFASQNGMDVAWLWGLVPLPDDMNMAEYAHRGAYPLIGTALLAGLFVLVTLRPGSATAAVPLIRWLVTLWIAQNILLVASSALRTIDYVEAYSLTLLRLAALEWMALVALGLVFILWRMLAGKSGPWLINANAAAAMLLLSVAAFVDHGAIVARWNTTHAREVGGKGVELDLCYMRGLGSSALLPLVELERNPRLTDDFRKRVTATRIGIRNAIRWSEQAGFWTIRSQQRARQADAIVIGNGLPKVTASDRDCHGRLYNPPPPVAAAPTAPSTPAPLTQPARQ
jgi:Domain of unknown function (DUF4173)